MCITVHPKHAEVREVHMHLCCEVCDSIVHRKAITLYAFHPLQMLTGFSGVNIALHKIGEKQK